MVGLKAVDAGFHDHVQNQEIRPLVFQQFDGLLATFRRLSDITELLDDLRCDLALFQHIIDYEHCFTGSLIRIEGIQRHRGQ